MRSAMHAASQLPGRGPTECGCCPCMLINNLIMIIGLNARKPVFGRFADAQSDQRLCYSHFGKYHI